MLYLLLALFTAAIVAVDQLTKYLAAANLVGKTVTLIHGWLQLHYITNDGMALSLLRGARWLFVVMTAVYLAVAIYVLVKNGSKRRRSCGASRPSPAARSAISSTASPRALSLT